jgi:hypothetical protein
MKIKEGKRKENEKKDHWRKTRENLVTSVAQL